MLEANLDDLNPQVFGYVIDRLLEEGALDAFAAAGADEEESSGNAADGVVPAGGRVQADADDFHGDHHAWSSATRRSSARRWPRKWITVTTQWGDVRLKIASMNGTVTNYAPEYEDCRRIAAEHHVPLKTRDARGHAIQPICWPGKTEGCTAKRP